VVARVAGRLTAARGSALRLGWRAQDAHLFEAASGQRRDDLAPLVLDAGTRLGLAI